MSSKTYKQIILINVKDNVTEKKDTQNKTKEQLCQQITSY